MRRGPSGNTTKGNIIQETVCQMTRGTVGYLQKYGLARQNSKTKQHTISAVDRYNQFIHILFNEEYATAH